MACDREQRGLECARLGASAGIAPTLLCWQAGQRTCSAQCSRTTSQGSGLRARLASVSGLQLHVPEQSRHNPAPQNAGDRRHSNASPNLDQHFLVEIRCMQLEYQIIARVHAHSRCPSNSASTPSGMPRGEVTPDW